MRKFHSPVNLKAAADAALHTVAVDVTLAELVQAHALARPSLELELRLRKWCDPVLGFGHESAWAISSERLKNAAQALIDAGYAFSSVNRDIGALGQVFRWAIVERRMAPRGFISPTIHIKRFEESMRYVASSEQDIASLRLAAKMGKDRLFTLFVWMLVDSGARKSEVLRRTWQELDISSGKVIVPRTKNVDSRTLFFTPETMALAKRLKPTLATWPYRDRAVLFLGLLNISVAGSFAVVAFWPRWRALATATFMAGLTALSLGAQSPLLDARGYQENLGPALWKESPALAVMVEWSVRAATQWAPVSELTHRHLLFDYAFEPVLQAR